MKIYRFVDSSSTRCALAAALRPRACTATSLAIGGVSEELSNQRTLAEAEAEIWEALGAESPDQQRVLAVIDRVQQHYVPHDADWAAALGYFWYLVPGSDQVRAREGVRWLREALALEPQHPLALLYLAHFYYDSGDMENAIGPLRAIPNGHFAARGQLWRDLKIRELILAADLRLGRPDEIAIRRFQQDHAAAPEDNKANPIELVAAAKALLKDTASLAAVRTILDWARQLGLDRAES